jgi:Family of unknown function (DUF5670)
MLWALAVIEVVLWVYGMAAGHRLGGFLHWLLALAALAVVTELGLRWRRQWTIRRTTTTARDRSQWRKAA